MNKYSDANNLTEDVQIIYVQIGHTLIRNIKNPSLRVQLSAVKKDWRAIVYIDHPTPMIQAAACRQSTEAWHNIHPESCRDPSLKNIYK